MLGCLTTVVAISLVPPGPWLIPLDLAVLGFLVVGALESARILRAPR